MSDTVELNQYINKLETQISWVPINSQDGINLYSSDAFKIDCNKLVYKGVTVMISNDPYEIA